MVSLIMLGIFSLLSAAACLASLVGVPFADYETIEKSFKAGSFYELMNLGWDIIKLIPLPINTVIFLIAVAEILCIEFLYFVMTFFMGKRFSVIIFFIFVGSVIYLIAGIFYHKIIMGKRVSLRSDNKYGIFMVGFSLCAVTCLAVFLHILRGHEVYGIIQFVWMFVAVAAIWCCSHYFSFSLIENEKV